MAFSITALIIIVIIFTFLSYAKCDNNILNHDEHIESKISIQINYDFTSL